MSENGERDEVEWVMCETATGRVLDRWTEPAPTYWRTPDPLPEGYSMSEDYGTREITPEDRRRAVLYELMNSRSNVRITEGMRRGLRKQRRPWMTRRAKFWLAVAIAMSAAIGVLIAMPGYGAAEIVAGLTLGGCGGLCLGRALIFHDL